MVQLSTANVDTLDDLKQLVKARIELVEGGE